MQARISGAAAARLRCLAILCAFCASACTGALRPPGAENAAIYAAVFDSIYATSRPQVVIVAEGTLVRPAEPLPEPYRQRFLATFGVRESTLASHEQAWQRKQLLPAIQPKRVHIQLVPDSVFDGFPRGKLERPLPEDPERERMRYWHAFRARFPRQRGYYRVTPIGYSSDGSQALLEIGWHCGSDCGEGHQVLLEKRNGAWRVLSIARTWIS